MIQVDSEKNRIFAPNQAALDEAKEKIEELASEEVKAHLCARTVIS